jgi:hypothetical protein
MERTSIVSIDIVRNVARACLVSLFAVNVFRAAMLSITPPEADAYHRFVRAPLYEALAQYDANNHVLYTLLARISTSFFHLTELSLRLPSLLCGALYLCAVYRLSRRAFGSGGLFLTAVGLLTLNPLVLDHMSAARGYGMALAFWMWGLQLLLECLERFSGRKLKLAAVCLGLSVSASLAFVAPAAALAVVFAFSGRRRIPASDRWHLPLYFLITAFLFLAIPLNRADAGSFSQGATSLRQTLSELTALTIYPSQILYVTVRITLVILIVLAVFAAVRKTAEWLTVLTAGTMVLSLVLIVVGHRWLRIPYPLRGGALYFIPVTALAVMALVCQLQRKAATVAFLVLSALCCARYLSEFNLNAYREWPAYADSRSLAKALRADAGKRRVRIGASPQVEPVLNYFRDRYGQGNWEVEILPLAGRIDYYVLNQEDTRLIQERDLKVIYRDAGLVLAR